MDNRQNRVGTAYYLIRKGAIVSERAAITSPRDGQSEKFDLRRRALADAALEAIADGGYARTGLREIAARAELTHGILHYYFDDKDDLIAQAVWQYKSACARRYDPIIETAVTADEFVERLTAEMAKTLRDEADMHRLWYDLRNQSLFDSGFRETIVAIDILLTDMVWMIITRFAELAGLEVRVSRDEAYALFDGVFLNALIAFVRGDLDAPDVLRGRAGRLLASATAA